MGFYIILLVFTRAFLFENKVHFLTLGYFYLLLPLKKPSWLGKWICLVWGLFVKKIVGVGSRDFSRWLQLATRISFPLIVPLEISSRFKFSLSFEVRIFITLLFLIWIVVCRLQMVYWVIAIMFPISRIEFELYLGFPHIGIWKWELLWCYAAHFFMCGRNADFIAFM